MTAFLDREQVETRFIPRKPGRRTSAVILTIQPPDRFPLTFYRDNCADRALTIDDVARAPVAESRVVFVTGTGLSHEPARAATVAAAAAARAAGVPVVVDIDYRADQWDGAGAFAAQMRRAAAIGHAGRGDRGRARRRVGNDRRRRRRRTRCSTAAWRR